MNAKQKAAAADNAAVDNAIAAIRESRAKPVPAGVVSILRRMADKMSATTGMPADMAWAMETQTAGALPSGRGWPMVEIAAAVGYPFPGFESVAA